MKSAWKSVEKEAYEVARKHALANKVFKEPDRMDLIGWKTEMAIWLPEVDISDTYEAITVDGAENNYGCLKVIMTEEEYLERTTLDFTEPEQPDHYDATITDEMARHTRKRMEEIHSQKQHDYWTWKGTERGVAENIRDAMPEQYFVALKHPLTAYAKVTALTILEHVGSTYATMDTRSKKKLKAKYYRPWDVGGGELLSQFTQDLETKRVELAFHGVNIVESDLVDHFIEQMYHSKAFTKSDMKEWEAKGDDDKEDWEVIKVYFEERMAATKKYHQNAGEEETYGSIQNATEEKMADLGDDLREIILSITQQKESGGQSENAQIIAMQKQMNELAAMMKTMCTQIGSNKENEGTNTGTGSGGRGGDGKPWRSIRNMGAYCHSCGYHPIGAKHTSETCTRKKDGHDDKATFSNRGTGGSDYWPGITKVKADQLDHVAYKGKAKPTN